MRAKLIGLFVVLLLVGGAVWLVAGGGESDEPGHELEAGEEGEEAEGAMPENALREVAREGYERHAAVFEVGGEEAEGGEASRGGPNSPAAQAVSDRAYPRNYVDDKLARRTLKAFNAIPGDPTGGASKAARATAADKPWTELGPVHPDVPGEPSQFFDPETLSGPSTQESGRVGPIAIDPACTSGDCRMAVATAGGGVWTTDDALAGNVQWSPPPNDVPTTAFGSLYFDAANDVLYAGSGEPNGSSDSEAGLGLFKSTDFGDSWTQLPGSVPVATNRAIGAIAVDPNDPDTIYIGTALARHGSSSVNGGRRTPPDAPPLGVYRSTDGGQTFEREEDLSSDGKAQPDPTPPDDPDGGVDFFAGGISKLAFDPNDPNMLYAAVFGYGLWRADQGQADPVWRQVFHTMNQNDFTQPPPDDFLGDSTGDETEFDFVDLGANTRIFVGDASDDWAIDGDDTTPAPRAWRVNNAAAITPDGDGHLPPSDPMGDTFNTNQGWVEMSSDDPADSGFGVYNYCQNGQCSYDSLVAHPPGSGPGTVWYLGSMNYDELKVYDRNGLGVPPRSNGRAVIRSTNAGAATPATNVDWADMTAVLADPTDDWDVDVGIHPDLRSAAFADNGNVAFIGGDGGIYRVDVSSTQDQSQSCAERTWDYNGNGDDTDDGTLGTNPDAADDLTTCEMLLSAVPAGIGPVNDGLRTIQFQSLSLNPKSPTTQVFGGTQDNGTWSFDAARPEATRWFESVGGDGGQSGFDQTGGPVRYHNYFDATPEVNFHGDDPTQWLDIYDPLQITPEARSFYTPFEVDPTTAGRLFSGLQHVWRTDDNGGDEQELVANGCLANQLDPFRTEPCGDWVEMGGDLTSTAFGSSRAGNYVVAVERAPSDSGTLWAATRVGRLFVTSNSDDTPGSVSFHRIDTAQTPGRFVTGIAIDPANPNHAWVSYTGYDAYTPSTPGHVFEVTYDPATHSATFKDRSFNLGDQPVTALVTYGKSGSLFAGTDFGVLELPAGTQEWITAGSGGLPHVAVYGLTLSDSGQVLYAATHGRGAYRLDLPPAEGGGGGGETHPTAHLDRIKKKKVGQKSKIKGTATDEGGVQSIKLKFGDGEKKQLDLAAIGGKFKVKHRYDEAGKYTVKLIVTATDGEKAKDERKAVVKPKRKHKGGGGK
jgi:hypothetical protein